MSVGREGDGKWEWMLGGGGGGGALEKCYSYCHVIDQSLKVFRYKSLTSPPVGCQKLLNALVNGLTTHQRRFEDSNIIHEFCKKFTDVVQRWIVLVCMCKRSENIQVCVWKMTWNQVYIVRSSFEGTNGLIDDSGGYSTTGVCVL